MTPLEKSIQKWEQIIAGDLPYANGASPCALCTEYFDNTTRCKGCELAAAGHYCMDGGSIYRRYADASRRGNDDLCHEIAHEMLTALREGRVY